MTQDDYDRHFLQMAIAAATRGVETLTGGPFGAVVTRSNKVLAVACNSVTSTHDPTAHAEVNAIREACAGLEEHELKDCTLYSSAEPCPMCFGAIYWARMKRVVFAADTDVTAEYDFDDTFIYDEIEKPHHEQDIPFVQLDMEDDTMPFEAWERNENRIPY